MALVLIGRGAALSDVTAVNRGSGPQAGTRRALQGRPVALPRNSLIPCRSGLSFATWSAPRTLWLLRPRDPLSEQSSPRIAVGRGPVRSRTRRRRTLALSSLIWASPSLVAPCRWPPSTWVWSTQRRTDSLPTPSRRATTSAVAVSDGYSGKCSSTWRTHRSWTFGSILFGMNCILTTHKDATRYLGRFRVRRWRR